MIEGEILKRKLSSSNFDFHNLDQFVGEVISKHAPNSAPNDPLQKKHKYISWLLTQLVHMIGTPFLRIDAYKTRVRRVSPRCEIEQSHGGGIGSWPILKADNT